MKVKSESEVAQLCPTLATPWTAAHQALPSMGFFQAKVLEWGAIAFSDITPKLTQIRVDKLSTLNDFQKLLGVINWIRPSLGITNYQLTI